MSESVSLKREIAKLERGRGRRYPSELRARVTRYVRGRRGDGASWASLGEELGVPFETLRRWGLEDDGATGLTSLVPVEVVTAPSVEPIAVVSPSGWRLEGLDLREALAVLRALS